MIIEVKGIKQISVIDKNQKDIVVKEGETFETTETYGKSYLINYPQYFQKVLVKSEIVENNDNDKSNDNADKPRELNNKELADLIIAKGGKPAGNKEQLKAILVELEANETSEPVENTDTSEDNSDETNPVDENDVK